MSGFVYDKQPSKKRRKRKTSASPSSSDSSSRLGPQWLCAHPEAQKNFRKPVITLDTSTRESNKKTLDSQGFSQIQPALQDKPPSPSLYHSKYPDFMLYDNPPSPSLYHPKRSYFQGKLKSKGPVEVEFSECPFKPPPSLFTEGWVSDSGLDDSPNSSSVNFLLPTPIKFSEDFC